MYVCVCVFRGELWSALLMFIALTLTILAFCESNGCLFHFASWVVDLVPSLAAFCEWVSECNGIFLWLIRFVHAIVERVQLNVPQVSSWRNRIFRFIFNTSARFSCSLSRANWKGVRLYFWCVCVYYYYCNTEKMAFACTRQFAK